MRSATSLVDVTVAGPVATVTLNRPQTLNAQTLRTWSELARIPDRLDDSVRVVVVRGAGRSFSAGLDRRAFTDGTLAGIAALPDTEAEARIEAFQAAFGWLADPARISIAAVQGHAIGAGCQLALACHLIVATADAEFAMAEVTLGLVPDLGGIARLVAAVGERRALELCASGRRFRAAEAEQLGLVHAVVARDKLDNAVETLAQSFISNPAAAVRSVTRLLTGADGRAAAAQNALDRSAQLPLLRALAARPTGSPPVARPTV